MKIVSWQSVLTEHQVHTFRELEKLAGEPVEFVLGQRELSARKDQGWTTVDLAGLSVHELPMYGWWQVGAELMRRYPDALHLFNGMWGDRRFFPLLLYAQLRGIRTGLMTEPYADVTVSYFGNQRRWIDAIKSAARPLVYRLLGGLVARRMSMVFAISSKAVAQFESVGFKAERIFPFGYFVPAAAVEEPRGNRPAASTTLRLVFIGSLIERKGLPTLLRAVKTCRTSGFDVVLVVFGPGNPPVQDAAQQGVEFRGVIPFGEAQRFVCGYDVLVLPSLHDGWGVVVNEALLQGVPVIVSDAVGARTLVEKSGAGHVFQAGEAESLARALVALCDNPVLLGQWRDAAEDFRQQLSPEVAAKYLYDCMRFVSGLTQCRPCAPWYV